MLKIMDNLTQVILLLYIIWIDKYVFSSFKIRNFYF